MPEHPSGGIALDYHSIFCPHCGKELHVPEDADRIVCMFCAAPISLHPDTGAATSPGQAAEKLPEEAFSMVIRLDQLNGKKYAELFQAYCDLIQPALEAYLLEESRFGPKATEAFADRFLKGFSHREENKSSEFDLRITLTALAIPAILAGNNPATDALADHLLSRWNASHKSPLGKATYEEIANGFHRKLCFITTAVCKELKKGDDCEELTALRAFRDGYLLNTPNGAEKISEYYLFAPMIVNAIRKYGTSDFEWGRIYQKHLFPCLRSIRAGRPEQCEQLYESMMRELEKKWL